MAKRGRSKAAKEALKRLQRFKTRPKDRQIKDIAKDTGLHFTTVYRLLANSA